MFASLAMHVIMQKMSTECVNSPTKSAYSNNVLCTNLTSLNQRPLRVFAAVYL